MSDFFIKNANWGSGGWRKATNIFIKNAGWGSGGWRSAIGVWIRNSTQWLKVWPLSGVFASRRPWIGDNSTTAYADRKTSTGAIRIGSNYYGNNAQWDSNGWTITGYSYKWNYYSFQTDSVPAGQIDSGTGSGWTTTSGQDLLPTTIWTASNADLLDESYLAFQVNATASNSTYNGVSESDRVIVVRQQPLNLTASLSTNSPEQNVQITYSSSWDTSIARKIDTTRTTAYWYRNSTNSTTGGTYVGSGYSYTPGVDDVNNYLYVVETSYNSGTDFDLGSTVGVEVKVITTNKVTGQSFQKTGSQRRVSLPANFLPGTTIYVSTNGFISWGADPARSISIPTEGITLAPLNADLRQGDVTSNGTNTSAGGLWHYADSTNFYVRWEGNQYQNYDQLAEYQVKFYWNQSYADVYFITNSLTSSTPSTVAVQNGSSVFKNWNESTAQSSTLLATSSMTKVTTQDGQDDERTEIVTGTPPGNLTNGVLRNFSIGNSHLFLTTGTNTSSVKTMYRFALDSSFTVGPFTNSTSNSTPYQLTHYLLQYLILKTWNEDTYSPSASYSVGSIVWYSGNRYQAIWDFTPTFSGQIPTNTAYWAKILTVTYNVGDYVLRNGVYYFCKAQTSGTYPTNTNFWINGYFPFAYTATPYNGSIAGSDYSDGSTIFIRPDATSDTVAISAGPTISNITQNSMRATYTTSIYTNRVVVDFKKGSPLTSLTGYPYTKTVSGATEYTETPSGLTSGTLHYFYFTPRYLYSADPEVYFQGAQKSANDTTLSPTLYTVSFDVNGSGGTAPSSVTQTVQGGTVTLASAITRTGYTFGGWNTNASGTGTTYTAGSSYTPSSNVTLYAKWTANTYSIGYNANSATSGTAPASQTKTHGTDLTLRTNSGSLARTGYTFGGWNTASDGSGTSYAAGGTYSTDAAATMYAKWNSLTYTVTYASNGATSGTAPASQTKTHGTDLTLRTNTGNLAKTGWTFSGWNTATNGSGTTYSSGGTYSTNADLSLNALWSRTLTLSFNANGGTGAPASQTGTDYGAGTTITITSSTPSRTGYTFNGWATSAMGTSSYAAGGSITITSNTTLYATWTATGGGGGTPGTPTVTSIRYTGCGYTTVYWANTTNSSTYDVYRSTSTTAPTAATTPTATGLTDSGDGVTDGIVFYEWPASTSAYYWARGVSSDGTKGSWSARSTPSSSAAAC